MKLILASGSPRRAELLERMGLQFTVLSTRADETLQAGLTPQQQVMRLSLAKAEAAAALLQAAKQPCEPQACVILSADTVVVLETEILGKPADEAAAVRMLSALSGRSHTVMTGVTLLLPGGEPVTCCEETEVTFRKLSPGEIRSYVATGEPMDKAGAYGIQGLAAMFIRGIRGDYYNVMGLPVCRTCELLKAAGIPILEETT